MRAKLFLFLFAALLLIPLVSASAASINQLGSNTVLDDDLAIFRYRANPGIWQRSASQQDLVTAAKVYNGSAYFVVTSPGGQFRIISSPNGLRFNERFVSQEPVSLTDLGDILVGAAPNQAAVFSEDSQTVFELPSHPYTDPAGYFAQTTLGTIFSVIANNRVDIYLLASSVTSPRWSFSCGTAAQYRLPELLIQCDDTVWRYQAGVFVSLLGPATYLAGSDQLRLWRSLIDGEFYLYDGTVTALTFSDFQPGDTLEIAGDRLFYRKTAGLFEVAWRLPAVEIAGLPATGALRSTDGDKKVLLQTSGALYYSKSFNSWVATNLSGAVAMHSSAGGLIAYLPEGSGAYYENTPGNFLEMDSSWAASSKIKTLAETQQGLLLVLRNSSNNPNIYRSTDFRSWQRVTMPTFPTIIATIGEARALPADTAVEADGVVTVLPGLAGDEIVYLEDGTSGIQLFLSKSKGQYPLTAPARVTAIGKISSSTVGRILLDAANTVIVGSPAVVIDKEYAIVEAKSRLGQTALLRGSLSGLNTDSGTLTDQTDSIKLHFDGIKAQFQSGDTILVRVVVDDNSSTDQVEAWFAGGTAKLITAAPAPVEETAVVKTTAAKPATAAPSTIGRSTAPAVSQSARPIPNVATTAVQVAGAHSEKPLPNSLVFSAGILAGALIVRGRRFQKYLPGN
ncbi:MAG: hypothetical protein WEC83_00320 [Patescibacteria group bacterium]